MRRDDLTVLWISSVLVVIVATAVAFSVLVLDRRPSTAEFVESLGLIEPQAARLTPGGGLRLRYVEMEVLSDRGPCPAHSTERSIGSEHLQPVYQASAPRAGLIEPGATSTDDL